MVSDGRVARETDRQCNPCILCSMFTASSSARPARSTQHQQTARGFVEKKTWRRLSPCPWSTRTANRTPECPVRTAQVCKPHTRRTATLGGPTQEKTATRYGRRRSMARTGQDAPQGSKHGGADSCTLRVFTPIPSHPIPSHRVPSHLTASCISAQAQTQTQTHCT